jgi:hypothetical protein
MQLMREILDRVYAVNLDNVSAPSDGVSEGETVLGELPDELKKFYTVLLAEADNLERTLKKLGDEFEELRSIGTDFGTEKEAGFLQRYNIAHLRYSMVNLIFWNAVLRHFPDPIQAHNDLNIRKGWKVVVIHKEPPTLADLILSL